VTRCVSCFALLASLAVASGARAETEAGGEHARLAGARGIVHVWRPANYAAASAGIVIYVHGYATGVDRAWREHGLAAQFAESRENAIFIAPEAPTRVGEPVLWSSLGMLLETVARAQPLPKGPLVVVGHSGAFRTILPWLGDRRVRNLILLDGLYGRDLPFHAWLKSGARGPRAKQLVVVAAETSTKAERFAARYRASARLPAVPASSDTVTEKERRAPVILMRSQYEHNAIVTSGRVIPLLLQLMPLPRI
jgi:hypothetical protein